MLKRAAISFVVVLILAAGAWYTWPSAPLQITNYPSRGTDIIAFGDSLIAGKGATEGNDLVSDLSRAINRPIVNLGRSGDTTGAALSRVQEMDAYNPQVVIILLGGNDALHGVAHEETFANLSHIIEYAQGRGAVVLLLGIRGGLLPLGDPYRARFDELRTKYHTAYVSDVLSGVFNNNKYMSDIIHPNDAGYAYIAQRVVPILAELVQ